MMSLVTRSDIDIWFHNQCRFYIEAKEAVQKKQCLGAPGLKGPPNLYKKNCCRITITRNAFNKMLIQLLIKFGYGAVGAPRGITVAWGLTRPKFGPVHKVHPVQGTVCTSWNLMALCASA